MDKATEVVADVKEKVEEVAEQASTKLEEMGVPEQVSQFVDTAKDKLSEATDWAEEKAAVAKEKIAEVVETVEAKVEDLTGDKTEDTPSAEANPKFLFKEFGICI
jgi:chitodextrinase